MITIDLTTQEQLAFAALQNVHGRSVWHHAINHVLQTKNPDKFRQLISELKSQAFDCPSVMEGIIGEKAFEAIVFI